MEFVGAGEGWVCGVDVGVLGGRCMCLDACVCLHLLYYCCVVFRLL